MKSNLYRKWAGRFTAAACTSAVLLTCAPTHAGTPFSGIDSHSKFLIYYGNDFSTTNLNAMSAFNVVVLGDPANTGVTPANVAYLHNHGVSFVLGYISIGEDVASTQNGASLIVGDGTGPVYMDSSNVIHYENKGIASFYVDEWTKNATPGGLPSAGSDNLADTNWNFNGYFIWPNAAWRSILNSETYSATAGVRSCVGLAQLMGTRTSDTDTNRAHNFGFDGVFLDTLDTAGPYDGVPGYYSWAAQEMSNTVSYIHTTYPTKMVLANRGMFFYNSDQTSSTHHIHPYDYDIRPYVNGTLMESWHLDSNASNTGINPSWNDNYLNYGRKVSAEANRPDGFTVFCLDYQCSRSTSLYDEGIRYAITDNGWTYYQAGDGSLTDVNTYVSTHMPATDTVAPIWSTAQTPGYISGSNYTDTSNPYTALTGLQALVAGPTSGDVTAQWDLALDQTGPIHYSLYQSTDAAFTAATVYPNVNYAVGAGWSTAASTHNANQYTIPAVAPGTYYFRIRATDALSHQDTNSSTITYTVLPGQVSNPVADGAISLDGSLSDWSSLRSFGQKPIDLTGSANPFVPVNSSMANDTTSIYINFTNATTVSSLTSASRVFLDTDANRATGYTGGSNNFPVGAEYMIEGNFLYKYTGTGGTNWGWSSAISGALGYTYAGSVVEMFIPRTFLGNSKNINYFLYDDNSGTSGSLDVYPMNALAIGGGGGYCAYKLVDTYNPVTTTALSVDGSLSDWSSLTSFGTKSADVSGSSNPVDWQVGYAAHDGANLYLAFTNYNSIGTLDGKYSIFVDTDSNPSTGFKGGSGNFPVGAEYMVQGTGLWKYMGSGTNWSWGNGTTVGVAVATVTSQVSGSSAEIKFATSLIGSPSIVRLFFFGDNTGSGGVYDYYPANAITSNSTGNYLVYRLDDVSSNATITVDGSLTDWSSLRSFPKKQDDTNGTTDPLDFEKGWAANDSTNYYFAIQNANTVTLNWGTTIYIDTDCNRSTGFIGSGSNFPVGAEYMIQGTSVYKYMGTGTSWSWGNGTTVGVAVGTATAQTSGTNVEYSMPKSWIGTPGLFKLFVYGDNSAFTGGTVVDTYPSGALVTGGGGLYLTYRTHS